MRGLRDTKTKAVAGIILREFKRDIKNLLVVGCGSGVEAAILAECLGAKVTGIDVVDKFWTEASDTVTLQIGDATAIEFEDATFDFVYSYHSLEHVKYPIRALQEIKRVLTADGGYWIGTPNRHRILGYLGSKDANFCEKIKWNLIDFKARLLGKFRNEYGAHAGFAASELRMMLHGVFSENINITNIYFNEIYRRYKKLLRLLERTRLSVITYPSVYFMGKK